MKLRVEFEAWVESLEHPPADEQIELRMWAAWQASWRVANAEPVGADVELHTPRMG